MALPTTPPADVPSAATTPMPYILNVSPELHAKILEYLLIFPHPITNLSTEPHASANLKAMNSIGFTLIQTPILLVNHSLHTAAMDVLYRNNFITLDVATHCSLHSNHTAPSDSAIDKSYHRLKLQVLDAREQCDGFCVAKLLKRIVVPANDRLAGARQITVDLSGVHYTKYAGLATALAGQGMAYRFIGVGVAEARLSSVSIRFVWRGIGEVFEVMAGKMRAEIGYPLSLDAPPKVKEIDGRDPGMVQRVMCALLKFHQREDGEDESTWAESSHSPQEYEQITGYAVTGVDSDEDWSEDN
ncbi:hypothetical protein LTR97_004085 [Elasticomyces elasticus]|uniref:Uncharacterized protein n=1 Tax=Elasticomyces elasticus TaxID=574655 RepID=A0AAN7W9S1_9PEZI|nr:hypothetical protein LTR97_004085 [Elasticomyces elasticus]